MACDKIWCQFMNQMQRIQCAVKTSPFLPWEKTEDLNICWQGNDYVFLIHQKSYPWDFQNWSDADFSHCSAQVILARDLEILKERHPVLVN
jgi:hypothetical protein